MSAWVIALALSAGYLINRQLSVKQGLQERMAEFNSHAKPAKPGPETEEIRKVQATVPDAEKYLDINVSELPRAEVKKLTAAREAAHQEVAAYEAGPAPFQGVYLNMNDRGF